MKVMKATYHIGTGFVLLLALLLAACTADDSNDKKAPERQLHISLASSTYQNDDINTNRALPVGYEQLNVTDAFPNGKDLLAFIAHTTNASEVFVRRMNYVTKENDVTDWEKNITITDYSAPYCIYGFIPISDDTSDNISVSLLNTNSNYGAGAKMTISNLKPLTVSDPCVIVGAAKWGSSFTDTNINLGAFGYTFNKDETTDKICMLLDHLYAKFKFKIAVGAEYEALRTVKVKKMTLEALDASDNVIKAVTATVNIEANTSGTNPISSVSFNRTTTGTFTLFTLYDNVTTPKELTTTAEELPTTCLAPYDQERFQLTTDYEVYDKKGNLLKEHTGVKNKFTAAINNSLKKRGYIHTVTITVNPTYLQVLSDDDLEPPTIKVN